MSERQRLGALRKWAQWREDHPDHKATAKASSKAANERHAIKRFGSQAAKGYFYQQGEPIENKLVRIEAQDGKCANRACGAPIDLTTGHQDHDHETDMKRGVLCQKCNQALGLLHDDAAVVIGLAEYRQMFS